MKKMVLSGSSKLIDKINYWKDIFQKEYLILDYPKKIIEDNFKEIYPKRHIEFYENIKNADVLLIVNEDKDNIEGYIGSSSFAELSFGLAQKLVYNKEISLFLLKMPSENVFCYSEIKLWLEFGWVQIYE